MSDLKPISREAIPSAIERANRFLLLNEPLEAESICLDVLELDPDNQEVLICLIRALSAQFDHRLNPAFRQACEILPRLEDEYKRTYYHGVVCERRAKACHKRGGIGFGHVCYEWFKRAMEWFKRAEAIRPAGNDDAILRWNTCVRILDRNREIVPEQETGEQMLE